MISANKFWLIVTGLIIGNSIFMNALYLSIVKENLIKSRKQEISSLLNFARAQASIYIEKYEEFLLSREEAEAEIIQALSKINQGSQYIWINDHNAIARVHVRPEKIGIFQTSYVDHIAQLKNKEIIFITKPNVKPITEERVSKINGITKIPEWEWVLGYGVYMDEIEKDFLDIACRAIRINLAFILFTLGISFCIKRSIKDNQE